MSQETQTGEVAEEVFSVYVVALKTNYGFVSPERNSKKGHFFHASQLNLLKFSDLKVGDAVEVRGTVTGQPPKTQITGVVQPLGRAAVQAREQDSMRKRGEVVAEHLSRYGFRPVQSVVQLCMDRGWDAVDALYAAEKAATEARQPPPREPYSKAPIRRLPDSPELRTPAPPPRGVFVGNPPSPHLNKNPA